MEPMNRLPCGCRSHPDPEWMTGYEMLSVPSVLPCPGPKCWNHGFTNPPTARVWERTGSVPEDEERALMLIRSMRGQDVFLCGDCAAFLGPSVREAP